MEKEKMGQPESLTVYRNGRYSIVPLLFGLAVKRQDGTEMGRYRVHEVEQAVEAVDHMAQLEGEFASVSM